MTAGAQAVRPGRHCGLKSHDCGHSAATAAAPVHATVHSETGQSGGGQAMTVKLHAVTSSTRRSRHPMVPAHLRLPVTPPGPSGSARAGPSRLPWKLITPSVRAGGTLPGLNDNSSGLSSPSHGVHLHVPFSAAP